MPPSHIRLFSISFLALFFELACIRWFGSYVVFLTFFTNVVLLASFLGLSTGCLTASRKVDFINWTPLLTLAAAAAAVGTRLLYARLPQLVVNLGNQLSPQLVFFGAEFRHPDLASIVVPMEAIAGVFFLLVALIFLGLGQTMGRGLDRIPNRVHAYTINILGSLAGIVGFALVSVFRLSPFWWFAVSLAGCGFFLTGERWRRAGNGVCIVATILFVSLAQWGALSDSRNPLAPWLKRLAARVAPSAAADDRQTLWSPYYRINYSPEKKTIAVNDIGHQQMVDIGAKGLAYALPYSLSRDAGRPPIRDALMIGAGAGNDVAAALQAGVERVDAVEIDPVIYELGERFHPNRPYQDPRVRIHLDDGRSFLKKSGQKYDLVVYALVDSLVLHSGYSSVRLESFLFTRQAFSDVKARLRDDGVFVMYNYYRQGWIISRLVEMAREVFGREPLVILFPYCETIPEGATGGFAMILVGDTDRLEHAFQTQGSYWIPRTNFITHAEGTGFGPSPPADRLVGEMARITPAAVSPSSAADIIPDDSWPFLYLKGRAIPGLSLRGMAVIAVLSLLVLAGFAPRGALRLRRFNWVMFFLGAGFMLLETRSVVHMALLFGATWVVNSIVFFAILVMILLSNLYVLLIRPKQLMWHYGALAASLVLNIIVDPGVFLGLPAPVKTVASCLLAFLPIFFAGVIFAACFKESAEPDRDFGANIAGVVFGGLAENISMIAGFQNLLWLALAFYLLSRALRPARRTRPI
ncbi:MAG: hypothetical protein NTW86_31450 [Candidatus Sumerlaeota bacterium]|nr:hypothetical protein [Candidatus Sumerlaeota bacterium]